MDFSSKTSHDGFYSAVHVSVILGKIK
uniref:Uncharacterized protein n=1 Tax=Anguilla anguilla TaxID=7936 RepID=A0A0E9PZ47_ANGAN